MFLVKFVARCEEATEVAVVSSKGQVVIPQALRKKLGIGPKTKLLVYGSKDTLVMRKLDVADLENQLKAIYKKIDRRIVKYGELTQEEIDEEIHKYRKEKADKSLGKTA
jgi:AbrB family looped-hinge helix DNA binding protein